MDTHKVERFGTLHMSINSFLLGKSWLKKFCILFEASNHGIARLEVFENEDAFARQISPKIIPLKECWKVSTLIDRYQENVFEIRTKDFSYKFAAEDEKELQDWIRSIQSVAFKIEGGSTCLSWSTTKEELQEENLLYCSVMNPAIFTVTVLPTEAALRNDLKGTYKIIISSVNFSIAELLSDGELGRFVSTWSYRHIRRYGCSNENFSFEAGRKCISGEGIFTFVTNEGKKIFQAIDGHVAYLRDKHGDEGHLPNNSIGNEDESNISKKTHDCKDSKGIEQECSETQETDAEEKSISKNRMKSLPPFGKPPRKSKPDSSDKNANESNSFTQNPSHRARITFHIASKSSISSGKLRSTDIDPVKEKVPSQTHRECIESAGPSKSSPVADSVDPYDPKKESDTKKKISSSDYENCFDFEKVSPPKSNVLEHVYGKLINVNQLTSNESALEASSATSNPSSSPEYCNVSVVKPDDSGESPKHFIRNDSAYALVKKKGEE